MISFQFIELLHKHILIIGQTEFHRNVNVGVFTSRSLLQPALEDQVKASKQGRLQQNHRCYDMYGQVLFIKQVVSTVAGLLMYTFIGSPERKFRFEITI